MSRRGPYSRAGKFNAQPTTVDNIRFASKAEARRYAELKLLEKAGEIARLERQPVFPIYGYKQLGSGESTHVCNYVADFGYYDVRAKVQVIEDVKGVRTPVYRLKRKLVEAQYDFTITEIGNGRRSVAQPPKDAQ